MSKNNKSVDASYIIQEINQHRWAATGVSDYPPRDPLVGQTRFYTQYRQFIRTVDQDADNFAHVFAVIGEWGRGKSRLGYELIAQINDCSKGWYVRNETRNLENVTLFDEETKRDEYLALYIRYSQVVCDYQNSDNWFGYGLYKALIPLATKEFDGSIQSEIAKQALRRLEPNGFSYLELSKILQLSENHSDEKLYYDDNLVTDLVHSAYAYLQKFGIKYILVVLDELETVAEAATYGLELDDTKRLDGQAIRLIGKAIKEEDPRRKLPWLRYVALCSPLLGQQLREIQSVARRFELVKLEGNAFADVSSYVNVLKDQKKLPHVYPLGLVEAAYAMSGANFGWFNVIMANVDVILEDYINAGKKVQSLAELFDTVLQSSGRVSSHVLDHQAIDGINTNNRDLLSEARSLMFGQLPIPLQQTKQLTLELLNHQNEYDEPVASRYIKVKWEYLDCRRALENYKFKREKEEWFYPSVEQGLNLLELLENLKTFSIHESEPESILVPVTQGEFKHLMQLLYNHPASEYAADAIWQHFFGAQIQLEPELATHIGPSVAMLLRLNMRYRSQQSNSMIFRDAEYANQHSKAMKDYNKATKRIGEDKTLIERTRLTGLFRLLDKNWSYSASPNYNKANLTILQTIKGSSQDSGLLHLDSLKLHPKKQAWFAWVNTKDHLNELHRQVAAVRPEAGRIPVMAFTASIGVTDYYLKGLSDETLKQDILLYHLNSSEIDVLEHIGLLPEYIKGFELKESVFTTKFKNRLNNIRDFVYKAIHGWRRELSKKGLIAWPLRPSAKINNNDRKLLIDAWKILCIEEPKLKGLYGLNQKHAEKGVDAEAVSSLFNRLLISPKVHAQGYEQEEQAGLFNNLTTPNQAQAQFPLFLARITNPAKNQQWTYEKALQSCYWGYLWSATGLNAKNVFDDWMWVAAECNLLKNQETAKKGGEWVTIRRSELENVIVEANNWLNGDEPNGYKEVVKLLESVYGSNRISGLFAPKGSRQEGTQTTHALENLKFAKDIFKELKYLEEQELGTLNLKEATKPLTKVVKARNEILKHVYDVYKKDTAPIELNQYKTVNLEDRTQSLFIRIEKARLFAIRVRHCAQQISEQVDTLIDEIVNDHEAHPPFPRSLFTLSLKTISHIFDGVLTQSTDGETASYESGSSSNTLNHFLRDLQIDKATERLELLSHEVGYDFHADIKKSFNEIDSYIISTYRHFKQRYHTLYNQKTGALNKVEILLKRLDSPPADYSYPEQSGELAALKNKLAYIDDSVKDLDEQVDSIRKQFSEQARKGEFSSLKNVPDKLLKPIQSVLAGLGGQINTIALKIDDYQNKKLELANGEIIEQLNPLLKAMGKSEIPLMTHTELDDLTLVEVEMAVNTRIASLTKQAEALLTDSGVAVSRWREIATALLNNQEPNLSIDEQTALVNKGILKVKVALCE